jgi:hypothetical protein
MSTDASRSTREHRCDHYPLDDLHLVRIEEVLLRRHEGADTTLG